MAKKSAEPKLEALGAEKVRTPRDPATWLLEAARRVPVMIYAIAVVGITAAVALSSAFVFGNYLVAIYGAIAVLVGMMLVRLYAVAQPVAKPVDVGLPIKVLVWAAVFAFVIVLAVGVLKLSLVTLNPPSPKPTPEPGPTEEQVSAWKEQLAALEPILQSASETAMTRAGLVDKLGDLRLYITDPTPMRWTRLKDQLEELKKMIESEIKEVLGAKAAFRYDYATFQDILDILERKRRRTDAILSLSTPHSPEDLERLKEYAQSFQEDREQLRKANERVAIYMKKLDDQITQN